MHGASSASKLKTIEAFSLSVAGVVVPGAPSSQPGKWSKLSLMQRPTWRFGGLGVPQRSGDPCPHEHLSSLLRSSEQRRV